MPASRDASLGRPSLFEGALLALLLWGALAFGAVYPWAYWPLAVGAAAVGIAGLVGGQGRLPAPLLAGVALVAGAIAVQAVPLPAALVDAISPNRAAIWALAHQAPSGAPPDAGNVTTAALSLQPGDTLRTLALFLAFALLMLGIVRRLDARGVVRVAAGIAGLGLIVAVTGLVDSPLGGNHGGQIYGFWQPLNMARSFSPFVNRNHFGGWMLMALPLSLGLAFGLTLGRRARAAAGWRNALLWLGTRDANQCALAGLAVLVMAFALVNTLSRSSIAGFFVVAGGFSAWLAARRGPRLTSFVLLAFLITVSVFAIRWTGTEVLEQRFTVKASDVGGRQDAWTQGARIASRFAWTGSGLNTYRLVAAADGGTDMRFDQTHNDYLQLAAEGGVLVAGAVVALLGVAAFQILGRFRDRHDTLLHYWIRVGALAGLAAIALQEVMEFSLQMPGNFALFAVLMALAVRP
jgi:hypothetical protein